MYEQLTIKGIGPSETSFRPESRDQAFRLLEGLANPCEPIPEFYNQPPSQAKWDNLVHLVSDPEWLNAKIEELLKRGRIPFLTTNNVDLNTGEILGKTEYSGLSSAGFLSYRQKKGSYRLLKAAWTKPRLIDAPNDVMSFVHRQFLDWVAEIAFISEAAYGLEAEKVYTDNAIAHAGNRYFLTMDIASAYQQVQPVRLAHAMSDRIKGAERIGPLGWFPIIKRYFQVEGARVGLATGGNASPILFNIYMHRFDEAMLAYSEAYGMTYTRYMDDITLSAPDSDNPEFDRIGGRKAAFGKQALLAMGMVVNDHKVRYKDIANQGPVMLPGVVLDADGQISIPLQSCVQMEKLFRSYRELIKGFEELDVSQIGQIHGMNSYLAQLESARCKKELETPGHERKLREMYLGLAAML